MERREILLLTLLFFLALVIRLVNLKEVTPYWDEWIYWDYAGRILANDFSPTFYIFHSASPFFSYILALVILQFNGDLHTLRVTSVIFGSLTVPVVYLFGQSVYDRTTGLIAALFMCFSAYHILFSRVIMIEAFAIFFMSMFLYLFWESQRREDQHAGWYAAIAGLFLGLAIDAKYLPVFLVPAIFLFTFWTRNFNYRALLDRRLIVTTGVAFLTFLPMVILWYITGANPVYEYAYVIPNSRAHLLSRAINTEPTSLVVTSLQQIIEIFSWDASRLPPPFGLLFVLSVIILMLVTLCIYLVKFWRREKEGSFFVIAILCLYSLIIFFITGKYYLMYSFPFWFVMISAVLLNSYRSLRITTGYGKILKLCILFFGVIMMASFVLSGVTAPYYGLNEQSWVDKALKFIKDDALMSGHEGEIIIGRVAFRDDVQYGIDHYELNASSYPIEKPGPEYSEVEPVELDMNKIISLNPDYLIFSEAQYDYLISTVNGIKLQEIYTKVFHSQTYLVRPGHAYSGYVLKRIDQGVMAGNRTGIEPSPPVSQGGEIDRDIFGQSIPAMMTIGKRYPVILQVKNTGLVSSNFSVRLDSDSNILTSDSFSLQDLNPGATRTMTLYIVPLKENTGELPVTAHLYDSETREIDTVTSYVNIIR